MQRRTFAIISHPDAGKTTVTEHMLLSAGAIHIAGAVKARGQKRRATSDWMAIERDRGISVASSVMSFEHKSMRFNLLDTPGHEDFSEDTYRTLTAADSAVMVLDAARGIEERTRKLFEICRLRNIPIITFINKLDREALDPLALLDDIENSLALTPCPLNWPDGSGGRFGGVTWLDSGRFTSFDSSISAPDESGRQDVQMAKELCTRFDKEPYLQGHATPVLFGAALRGFGVDALLDTLASTAPAPMAREVRRGDQVGTIFPDAAETTGFVFRIQANMDVKHRDRIAFMRVCSGRFEKGLRLKTSRGTAMSINAPVSFMAQSRIVADRALPGDIIGIPCRGTIRVGESLSESGQAVFRGIPRFAPEILRRVRLADPMKAKHVRKALTGMAEEGAVHVLTPMVGSDMIVGAVGQLQIEVLAERLRAENGIEVFLEAAVWQVARWVSSPDTMALEAFVADHLHAMATDLDRAPVFLAASDWELDFSSKRNPHIRFSDTVECLA